jgi:hypothetical protein
MSEQNVELARRVVRGMDVYNSPDVEALIAHCDPEIEFHSAFSVVGGAVYYGHDGMRSWFRDFAEIWGDEFRIEPEAYFDLGQYTLVFSVLHGRGKQSGAEVAMPTAQVVRWRDDLCVYLKGYVRREDALRDLGVSEDALEPIAP